MVLKHGDWFHIFIKGLTLKDRQMVKLMCNGTIENKDPDEAMEYINLLAENAQNWDTTKNYETPGKTKPQHLVEVCTTLGKIMTSKLNLHF